MPYLTGSKLAVVILAVSLPNIAWSDDSNAERRIAELESKVARLERIIEALGRGTDASPVEVTIPEARPDAQAKLTAGAKLIGEPAFSMPPELVPEIGKIGAEVGLLLSGSANPFKLNSGTYGAGFIDLPLFDGPKRFPGKVSYEILIGMSQSNTKFNVTSNVAQVANLAVLTALNPAGGVQNVVSAVTGTGSAPFPVSVSAETRLRLLQVVPFSMKYTSTALDRWRIRPYGVLGFGVFVTIHSQNPARGTPATFGVRSDAALSPELLATVNQLFGGQAPFGGPLVAGQISQAPELEARGLPGGHGNLDYGIHSALGFEYRVHRNFSIGFDARFNRIAGTNAVLKTYGSRIGLHF